MVVLRGVGVVRGSFSGMSMLGWIFTRGLYLGQSTC